MQHVLSKVLTGNKWVLALLVVLTSCSKDLESEELLVYTPIDGFSTEIQQVHFKWEELQGAEFYHLQIVKPSFDSIVYFVADTNLTGNEFFLSLAPGTYSWRMRAYNGGSTTDWTIARLLQIDTTSDLTGQSLTPLSPSSGIYLNQPYPLLSCNYLNIADQYLFEIRLGASWTGGSTVESGSSTINSYTPNSPLSEGRYFWGVWAENSRPSNTAVFNAELLIDLTVPGQPINLSPNGSTQGTSAFSFSWTRAIDNGIIQAPKSDSLFIYNDSGLSNLYKRTLVNGTTYVDSIPSTGTYYWVVKTFDAAGNIGQSSATATITIQ
jgi:hypothetical protein